MQNGAPDGIVLYDGTSVVQFLSYEGTFTASGGVANGLSSIDIGVVESNSAVTLPTYSMQLQGSGSLYADFTWNNNITNTHDLINTSQTITSAVCNEDGDLI
jgi:uncharacterized protein